MEGLQNNNFSNENYFFIKNPIFIAHLQKHFQGFGMFLGRVGLKNI